MLPPWPILEKSNTPRLAGDNKAPEATTTLHCEIVMTILTSQLTTYLRLPNEAEPLTHYEPKTNNTETRRKRGGAIDRPLRPSTTRLMPFPVEMERRLVRKAVVPAL